MTDLDTKLCPFHLAFPVRDLTETRDFYLNILGCREGRSSDRWIDFDLFGHQIVAHQIDDETVATADADAGDNAGDNAGADAGANAVDGHEVPVPHFGVVMDWQQWHEFAERLKGQGVSFVIEPHVRFPGEVGEQATMFFRDPSGNALEFKAFQDPEQLFAS